MVEARPGPTALRPGYMAALFGVLALVLVTFAYYGLQQARESTLETMERGARSLAEENSGGYYCHTARPPMPSRPPATYELGWIHAQSRAPSRARTSGSPWRARPRRASHAHPLGTCRRAVLQSSCFS